MNSLKQSGIAPIVIILIIVGVLVIGGVVLYYQKTLQIISQPVPQVTSQDETANWQTYRNEKYGFEVKYPTYWFIAEIVKPTETTSQLLIIQLNNEDTIGPDPVTGVKTPIIEIQVAKEGAFLFAPDSRVVNVAGVVGKKWLTQDILGNSGISTLWSYNNLQYLARASWSPSDEFQVITDDFNQILSTFKFTK